MRYLGGKTRLAPKIAPFIAEKTAGRPVWDAFCGGLGAAYAFAKAGLEVHCSDKHPGLIAMYNQVIKEPIPEDLAISAACHSWVRELPLDDPFHAFVRFGCSYGGNWTSGFARDSRGTNYAAESARSINRQVAEIVRRGGSFFVVDFLEFEPVPGAVLYLDPPYAGTTRYLYPLSADDFWAHATRWAEVTDVFVSEYTAPAEWGCIASWPHAGRMAGGEKPNAAIEHLFYRGP